MRRMMVLIAMLCVGLLLLETVAYAQQVKGTVINRDGAARSGCQVDFAGKAATYRVWTNPEGAFFLDNPLHGDYTVTVRQGDLSQTFQVFVNQDGLHPSNLAVDW
jgi:hypothetical protein